MPSRNSLGSMPPFSISVPRCPKCGEFPRGMSVTIEGSAHLYTEDKGKTFEFNGHTELGGGYKARVDKEGRTTLVCGGGHKWKAELVSLDQK